MTKRRLYALVILTFLALCVFDDFWGTDLPTIPKRSMRVVQGTCSAADDPGGDGNTVAMVDEREPVVIHTIAFVTVEDLNAPCSTNRHCTVRIHGPPGSSPACENNRKSSQRSEVPVRVWPCCQTAIWPPPLTCYSPYLGSPLSPFLRCLLSQSGRYTNNRMVGSVLAGTDRPARDEAIGLRAGFLVGRLPCQNAIADEPLQARCPGVGTRESRSLPPALVARTFRRFISRRHSGTGVREGRADT